MPGEAQQVFPIPAAHFIEQFLGGDYLDQTAIFQLEHLPVLQRDGLGKVHQYLVAMHEAQHLAAHAALVVFENDQIERRALGVIGRQDRDDAKHGH
ncbi:hypothetical protein D3C87_1837400 [compost metagenome]